MRKKETIVLGIIGCGTIGKFHLKNIMHNFLDVKIKFICDIDIGNVKSWAEKEGFDQGVKFTADYKDVLSDSDVNAVVISTQITQHTDILIDSARAGKHIFCEKQIGVNTKKIKKALDIVEKQNIKLQVGFHRRFDKSYIKAKKMIDNGEVGDIHIVRAITRLPRSLPPRYLKKGLFAGHFNELTSHDFDILRYLTGGEVSEIYAIGRTFIEPLYAEIGDYDTVMVSMVFDKGFLGNIDGSMQTTYGFDQRVEVFGTKASILVTNQTPTQIFLYN
jgi:myo-inositol 2-dehydrogenase / D-chiro-inositol 1-dehydrogenase